MQHASVVAGVREGFAAAARPLRGDRKREQKRGPVGAEEEQEAAPAVATAPFCMNAAGE
jgi:hypothetical protein